MENMVNIRFSLYESYKAGITDHPQIAVEKMGMKVLDFEGAPIGDCIFMKVQNPPETLPSYITLTQYEPNTDND